MVTQADVLRYLNRMDFPASRDDIVNEAAREGASAEVLRALRAMPPVDYANKMEVARSAGTDLVPEKTPAEKAVKARDRTHQRVAEHLRRV
jgi:hypothetical protein